MKQFLILIATLIAAAAFAGDSAKVNRSVLETNNGGPLSLSMTKNSDGTYTLNVVSSGGGGGDVTQSGTWTVQPGNTANTTPWLVTGTGGTFPVTGTFWQATQPVSGPVTDAQLRASAVPTSDAGPSWTTASGIAGARFTSADQSGAFASVTSAPTSGQKLVVTDIIVSVDTAMRVDFAVESATGTVIESVYMAANSTVNLITRGKRKLATADKKLQIKTSAAGNVSVNAFYYSES